MARLELSKALRGCAKLLESSIDLILGDLDERGRLAAASGTSDEPGLNVDQGLYDDVMKIHKISFDTGKAITASGAWILLGGGRGGGVLARVRLGRRGWGPAPVGLGGEPGVRQGVAIEEGTPEHALTSCTNQRASDPSLPGIQ